MKNGSAHAVMTLLVFVAISAVSVGHARSNDEKPEGTGILVSGDLRPIYAILDRDDRDTVATREDVAGIRARLGASRSFSGGVRFGARLAGLCSSEDCSLDFVAQHEIPDPRSGLRQGEFTFDELLAGYRRGRVDVAVGRLQTRFVLRGGVYAKSLDRNESNNVNVNWSDGLHATYHGDSGWVSHLVVQYNDPDGAGSIRRGPLAFDDSGARLSYFAAVENTTSRGPLVQRGLDVSYLPSSLVESADPGARREDYWGLVARTAVRWPPRDDGPRLRAGIEVGYAPQTATRQASRIPGAGDVNGLAWNVVASVMQLAPDHNIGINYGRAGGGWYLSPQYRENEDLFEIRYQWQPERLPLVEARVRWREEIDRLTGATQRRRDFDFYLRATWTFTIRDRVDTRTTLAPSAVLR